MELSSEGFCLFLAKQLCCYVEWQDVAHSEKFLLDLTVSLIKVSHLCFHQNRFLTIALILQDSFFEQESYCHQCVRFCCYLFGVIIQSSAWQLFMKYKYLKSWGHTEYHWHHGWAIHVSKTFWTEEQELIKITDFRFSLTIDQLTYFVEYFT